ncbi:hypothetical protein P153DRAFT_364817 [Dothidotthia symphoricarpi CBS 119687]|uniref:Uncharacterized protein n=1 Tax=Dothidotthia symphoricarpi CBS 119687 TaxID=1392245 RepID=A0A6A6ALG7_9PLEO|nr:uncharacterized protein P153DRAFT_364817 [Dothidotthia symphoricarpi CBS 119687]KAF2132416.1 hypothetical protein P153DRAFT_364817 [Dothidotthia symphoricarpi CBS 119687]
MLEDELDLGKRATKRELMAMSNTDLKSYLTKATSAHKHWWIAEQKSLKKSNTFNLEQELAQFQAKDKAVFNSSNKNR